MKSGNVERCAVRGNRVDHCASPKLPELGIQFGGGGTRIIKRGAFNRPLLAATDHEMCGEPNRVGNLLCVVSVNCVGFGGAGHDVVPPLLMTESYATLIAGVK